MFKIEQDQRVLFVGLVCVDLFNVLPTFPTEDQGHRCLDCYWQRGGNASNSATVLSLLGGNAEFFGTLSDDRELDFIQKDFKEYNIHFDKSVIIPNTSCPMSVVIISQETKTRTILHTNKNLPELSLSNFEQKIDLNSPSIRWTHFEGRDNAYEISRMLTHINQYNEDRKSADIGYKPIITSLEAEKLRLAPGLDKYNVWELPDVMFISKDFAKSQGYKTMTEVVSGYLLKLKKGAVVICAWGEEGAAANSEETGIVTSSAFLPETVQDTCGAGDTFVAATIFALSRGQGLLKAITFGCAVAGAKCGMQGFKGLSNVTRLA
ncbi:unnamed protein product [Candidula unifasciata]|uniref:Carbohydrate kinase PfkB domain-containing protein n=1 Tax=Candidula unifasciata TaxID=100452 RepID=A0A8S4A7R5_9EUPU|nr:unnamed protein product [Candidula unifasciata]